MLLSNNRLDTEKIRKQIETAALNRFRRYGYTKTTMAEIAKDNNMSAANLYRYFENKQEIAVHCTCQYIDERAELVRKAIQNPDLNASERLEKYILAVLHYSQKITSEYSNINELVETITSYRPDIVHYKFETETALLAEILSYGNETGEFAIANVNTAAHVLSHTLVLFDTPLFMGIYPIKEFEKTAKAVARLLIYGLKK